MKITNIRSIHPHAPQAPKDWRSSMGQILVAVDTDVGLTGYGVGGGGAAGVHVVNTVLRDLLLGQDPEPVEVWREKMYRATLPFGRKGLALMALSGVDLALWDLRGKAAGVPIVEWLGGRVDRPIPGYATLTGDPGPLIDQGYQAFKIHFMRYHGRCPDRQEVLEDAASVRAAIGPDRRLMLDAFMLWDVPTTLDMAHALAPLGLDWLEEPLSPDDWTGYAALADHSPIPIAGGEHEFTAASFSEIITRRLHTILQPDVCWCGGLTDLVSIYRLAHSAGLTVRPHRGSEPWSLHAIAALDPTPVAESGRPWLTWISTPPTFSSGFYTLHPSPGFGVTIDESSL